MLLIIETQQTLEIFRECYARNFNQLFTTQQYMNFVINIIVIFWMIEKRFHVLYKSSMILQFLTLKSYQNSLSD